MYNIVSNDVVTISNGCYRTVCI